MSDIQITEKDKHNAVEALLLDGAEFRVTRQILADWIEKHGYMFSRSSPYRAMQSNGLMIQDRDTWPSFHEMLADLLRYIDNAGANS